MQIKKALHNSLLMYSALTQVFAPMMPIFVGQAKAELAVLNATGVELKIFDFPTCSGTMHCAAHVIVDPTGAQAGTTANPLTVVGIGIAQGAATTSVTGSPIMAMALSGATTVVTNTLNYLVANTAGAVKVDMGYVGGTAVVVDPCQTALATFAPFGSALATSFVIATAVSAKKIYVCQFNIQASTTQNVALIEGTGGTCGGGTPAPIIGGPGTTAAVGWNFVANGGISVGSGGGFVMASGTTNVNVCLTNSIASQVSGSIKYVAF